LPFFSYIARQNVPSGDGKDAFQGGEVGGIRIGEPLAKSSIGEGSRRRSQGFGVGGVQFLGHLIEEVIVGAQDICGSREKGDWISL
jgi:hypothetical protein